ncbi:hypothetical protein QQ045_009403 [Rhodiola kirilowii]
MAMEIISNMNVEMAIFELDSTQVIAGVLCGSFGDYSGSIWGGRCLKLFAEHPRWELSHTWREANKGADLLARKACGESWRWTNRKAIPFCPSACYSRVACV